MGEKFKSHIRSLTLIAHIFCTLYLIVSSNYIDFIILGGTGNLAKKHIWTSLPQIRQGSNINIFAAGRSDIKIGNSKLNTIFKNLNLKTLKNEVSYIQLQNTANYEESCSILNTKTSNVINYGRVFYLAIPPVDHLRVYINIISFCKPNHGWTRIAIEKPFSAELLHHLIENNVTDVYLVDHYLWKRTIRDLHNFRFLNQHWLSNIWNKNHVDSIEFNLLERETVENRFEFYDSCNGVVGDILESHLTQLLLQTLVDCELNNSKLNVAKQLVAHSISVINPQDVYLARYKSYNGQSSTPTFASVALHISHPVWNTTSIFFHSGKALSLKTSGITLTFNDKTTINFSIYPHIAILVDKVLVGTSLNCGLNWTVTNEGCVANEVVDDSYTQIFQSIIRGDIVNFISPHVALSSREPWRKLKKLLLSSSKITIDEYQDYQELKLHHNQQWGWVREDNTGREEF